MADLPDKIQQLLSTAERLVSTAREVKEKEAAKKADVNLSAAKKAYDSLLKPHTNVIRGLEAVVKTLKEELTRLYKGKDPIDLGQGKGRVMFRTTKVASIIPGQQSLVPREYWGVNMTLIQAVVDKGVESIPGIKVTEERSVVVYTEGDGQEAEE